MNVVEILKAFVKVSRIDLNKDWCTCNTMFGIGFCSHLFKIALEEDIQLSGMESKS